MTDQASARRTKGAANGEFTLSDGSLRQQQVGDIGTGHHEEESHRAEENDQRQANFSGEGILQRDDSRVLEKIVPLLAGSFMNAARNRADIAIGLLRSHAIAEAPDGKIVMRGSAGVFAIEICWKP